MNLRFYLVLFSSVIWMQTTTVVAQSQETKEIVMPPQTGSHLPHRIAVPAKAGEASPPTKKTKAESTKEQPKETSSKPSPTPEPKRRKPVEPGTPTPDRFR